MLRRSLIVLLAVLLPSVTEAMAPPLSGKVVEVVRDEKLPLGQARVELLVPGSEEVKYHSYTDGRGIYAFREIEPGSYQVRVKLGELVFDQVHNNRARPLYKITVSARPARLNITVQKSASVGPS
jgi:hypothetical protein